MGFLEQYAAGTWTTCSMATILSITFIVVAICLCCNKSASSYGHFMNGMIAVAVLANYLYMDAFLRMDCVCGYINPYYGYCEYYNCYNFGNYYTVQFMALVWAIQMMTPLWIGLKLALPNRKFSTLCYVGTESRFKGTHYGLTFTFIFIYFLVFLVKISIAETYVDLQQFSFWYHYDDTVRVAFSKIFFVTVFIMNVMSTVFLATGISNMNSFLAAYKG